MASTYHSWHDMASTYHSFDRYRSTTNSYIEKQTAYGMIWLRHIIGLIHIDKIIGEVLERQHGIILIPEYLSVGWQVSIGEVHILLKSTTPIDNTHAIPIEIPIGYQWGIIPGVVCTCDHTAFFVHNIAEGETSYGLGWKVYIHGVTTRKTDFAFFK